ncbi:MAG: hypothetical protein PHU85_10400 [Phycisphaerae bacterium]|nr:hypothetical protein [Phycisphaerae bacterium]
MAVGSATQPAAVVSVSTSKPIADVRAQVDVASPELTVAPEGTATVSPTISVAAPASNPTSQSAVAAQNLDAASAGRDVKPVSVQVNASGSGWPIAAVAGLLLAVAWLWQRNAAKDRQRIGIARAVADMGPGPQRDELLSNVKTNLGPDRTDLDRALARHGLRVHKAPPPPAANEVGTSE